jgi:hypothetical protein
MRHFAGRAPLKGDQVRNRERFDKELRVDVHTANSQSEYRDYFRQRWLTLQILFGDLDSVMNR